MQWIGYVGLVLLAICWVPQSIETIKQGRCSVNFLFLILSSFGSFSLMLYALSLGDPVFSLLNAITTVGALINLFYKVFPRTLPPDSTS